MGRGRAKAKQAKVARQLKYQTSGTSIEELREELGAAQVPTVGPGDAADDSHDPYDGADEDEIDRYDEPADRAPYDGGDHGESPEGSDPAGGPESAGHER